MKAFIVLSALAILTVSSRKGGNNNNNRPTAAPPATTEPPAPVTTTGAPGPATTTASSGGCDGLHGAHVASLTSKTSVSSNSNCGDNAEGYFEECVIGDTRYVIVSGAPSHPAEYNQVHVNPNTRCERWQYAAVPVEWSASGNDYTAMGVVGYVMSGGTVYDHRSSPMGDIASYNEWDSLDPSFGHSDNNNQYHYHAVPTEWSNSADSSACEHIGYMIDGGKLYGYCEVDGAAVESCYVQNSAGTPTVETDYTYTAGSGCLLDECNMMEINGERAYVITPNYPYVPPCLKGNPSSMYGFTP